MRFSANLGFLFRELSLPDAVDAAAVHFEAVECHAPYHLPADEIRNALAKNVLPLISLNTAPGSVDTGEFGLAALPGRESDARAAIDQAIDYAGAVGAGAIHVMAGRTDGGMNARQTFEHNLVYACARAAEMDKTILIEPINPRDVPGYHLATLGTALETIERVGSERLKIMFDFYHMQIIQGDLIRTFETCHDLVGHVQIAAVPDRGAPDHGEVDYVEVLQAVRATGYSGFVGAEYRPRGATGGDLGWLSAMRARLGPAGG